MIPCRVDSFRNRTLDPSSPPGGGQMPGRQVAETYFVWPAFVRPCFASYIHDPDLLSAQAFLTGCRI
jgi:hypothetical protein